MFPKTSLYQPAVLSLQWQNRRLQNYTVRGIILTDMVALLLYLLLTTTGRALANSTPVAPDAPGKISGHITNNAGDPLAGIAVCITALNDDSSCPDEEQPALTNASGDYQIVGIGAGQYYLHFHDLTYGHFAEYYDNVPLGSSGVITPLLVAGNHVSGINASLTPAAKITGTLALVASNSYMQSGEVKLFALFEERWLLLSSNSLWQTSQSYQFLGLRPGEYRLCVEVQIRWENAIFPESSDQECYHEVTSGVEGATSLVLTASTTISNINFLVGENTTSNPQISGRVTDSSGKPLSGITVIGYLPDEDFSSDRLNRVETDGAGHYEFISLGQGRHLLQFFDRTGRYGFSYYQDALTLAQATPIVLSQSSNITNTNAALGASAHITGHVHYSSGDAPQTGQMLLFQHTAGRWRNVVPFQFDVDANTGLYDIGGLAAGVYRLEAIDNQAVDQRYATGYYGGATLEDAADITLATGETRRDVDIILAQGRYEGVITGTVTAEGIGLPGMRVTLYRLINYEPGPPIIPVKLLDLLTDANGHYSVAGLETGPYRVRFSDPARIYATVYAGNVQTENGSPVYMVDGSAVISNVNAALQPAGSITGTVRQVHGTAVPEVTVLAVWFNPKRSDWEFLNSYQAYPDTAGHYQVSGLLPGTYRVRFSDSLARYKELYYGSTDKFEMAQAVEVKSGATTTGIDVMLERIPSVYLPLVFLPPPRRQWGAEQIAHYKYVLDISCFCHFEFTQSVIITVRNGAMISITDTELRPITHPEYFSRYDTIPKLLNVIQEAIDKQAASLAAAYDPIDGYPTQVAIDYDTGIADDELSFHVSGFAVLE